MGCTKNSAGKWVDDTTGQVYETQGDCLFSGLSSSELEELLEESYVPTGWAESDPNAVTGQKTFYQKYGIYLVGVAAFVGLLVVLNFFGKGKK